MGNGMFEIGKIYKIVFKDGNYSKILTGKILDEELHIFCINDIKLGKVIIGKASLISSVKLEIGEEDGKV